MQRNHLKPLKTQLFHFPPHPDCCCSGINCCWFTRAGTAAWNGLSEVIFEFPLQLLFPWTIWFPFSRMHQPGLGFVLLADALGGFSCPSYAVNLGLSVRKQTRGAKSCFIRGREGKSPNPTTRTTRDVDALASVVKLGVKTLDLCISVFV